MKNLSKILGLLLLTVSLTAQNVISGGKEKIKIKGFLNQTVFIQDQAFKFGNGHNAEWVLPPADSQNKKFYGFDVRNTRLTLTYNGPEITKGWKLGGVLEMDFFGGQVGSSSFAPQMPVPRLRLAYTDFVHNNLRIRMGQAWTPMFGNVPVSVSHIAFPLGYGSAGFVGWRFPGIYIYQGLNSKESTVKMRFDVAMFANSWTGTGGNTNFMNAGNLGMPQFEVKMNFSGKLWSAYVVGHYDKKNLTTVDSENDNNLTGTALEFGAKLQIKGFIVQGNLYSGKNIGQQLGAITQFQNTNNDLRSLGGWIQIGYVLNKKLGIYGFFGKEKVNHNDVVTLELQRTGHTLTNFMIDYKLGQVTLGAEWLHSNLEYYDGEDKTANGNQYSFSCLYKF